METLAIERAKALFGAKWANVQPHSGSQANAAVYFAAIKPGDKILTMRLEDGGHLTHGHPMNFSGDFYEVVHYGVDPETGLIDYDQIEQMAEQEKPKMITVGASAYSRVSDFARMGEIAKKVGAYLLADIAHIAGLVAAGEHPVSNWTRGFRYDNDPQDSSGASRWSDFRHRPRAREKDQYLGIPRHPRRPAHACYCRQGDLLSGVCEARV